MTRYQVEHVLDIKSSLGECPMWCARYNSLLWIDIIKSTLNMFDPASGKHRVWTLPTSPGCFTLQDGGRRALIAAEGGFYSVDLCSDRIERVFNAPFDSEAFKFNDGKPDRQGRFCAGTVATNVLEADEPALGTIYSFDGATLTSIVDRVQVANGIAFSPDGKVMYRAESLQRRVLAYDYDTGTGLATKERLFFDVPEHLGFPDGATVDTEGYYWVALPFGREGGGIGRYSPDGALDLYLGLPVTLPTMVAFGGEAMSSLYVTSAARHVGPASFKGKSLGSEAGDIFRIETGFRGMAEATFEFEIG